MVREESKRHHRIFSGENVFALLAGQPNIAYISYPDWMDGHSTLMHCREDLEEILLIPPLSEVVGFEDTSYFLHFPSIPALHLQIPQISHPIAEKSYIQRGCGEANRLPTAFPLFVSLRAFYTAVSTLKTNDKWRLL